MYMQTRFCKTRILLWGGGSCNFQPSIGGGSVNFEPRGRGGSLVLQSLIYQIHRPTPPSPLLTSPLHQSGVAVAGATNAVNTYPRAFSTLPSFAHFKRPRWRLVGLSDRHLRSHGKGDCEQSSSEFFTQISEHFCAYFRLHSDLGIIG